MMKEMIRLSTALVVLALMTVIACQKDPVATLGGNNNNNNNPPQNTACNGKPLCFKLDDTLKTFDTVTCKKIAASGNNAERYRAYWQHLSGSVLTNIELDVYGSTTGTYNMKGAAPYVAGDGAFQYYKGGFFDMRGIKGSITVTAFDLTNKKISGTFKITASDNGTPHEITEGHFVDIPIK